MIPIRRRGVPVVRISQAVRRDDQADDSARVRRCGRSQLPAGDSQQALVFGEALGGNAALVISRAFGLRSLAGLQSIPADGAGPAWERGRWLDADGSVLTELDLRELVKAPAFAMIGV